MSASGTSRSIESHTRHLIALRLMPFLFVLYVIAFLDRTNTAAAALEMPHDLGFSDNVIGLGSGIFFLGYMLLEIPGAVIVERWSARRWITRIMVTWGFITVGMAFIQTPHQFYTVRFLLGMAEAGFFPGVIVFLTHWFIYEDRAKAVANFMAAVPLSYVLGAPVSGWLLGVHWFSIRGWRWLFILEGIPAVLFGVITWFYLTDWPRQAKWLSSEQQEWITEQLQKEREVKKSVHTYTIRQALCNRNVLLLTASYGIQNTFFYALSFWMPLILKRLSGLPDFSVTLLTALPYVIGFLAMQLNGWHSDRTKERRWHAAVPAFITGAALLVVGVTHLGTTQSIALFSTATIGMAYLPAFWTMPSAFLSDTAAAVTTGLINCVAVGLGGFAGPALMGYFVNRTHSFSSAFLCLAIASLVSGFLILSVRVTRSPQRLAAAVPAQA